MNIHARILVVDDDPLLLKSTCYMLESAGYETLGAGSGEDALQLVRANKPDLVLLDVNMPGMNGIEVCRRIKADPGMTGVYIILLSGSRTDSDSQAEGLETGADGFIVRPVTNRELLARLDATLRLKAAQAALRLSEEQYRGLFENATFGIYRTTPAGRITMTNPALVNMLGFKSSEELAQLDLIKGEVGPAYPRQDFQRRIEEDGKISGLISAWKRKDGAMIYVRESATLVRDENNLPLYYEGLVEDVTEQKQSEKLQDAIYRIAQAADRAGSLDSLYPSIYAIIKEIMIADNFYIALYDEGKDLLSFPFSIDEVDLLFDPQKLGRSLTAYVLRTAKSLLCDDALFESLKEQGEVDLVGSASPIWLGVPLMIEGKAIGVMVVQDYQDRLAYTEREQRVLEFVSSQVASAIHRKRKEKELSESESSLQAILGSTADGILAVDHDNKVLYTNERFMEMWRIPPAVRSSKDDAVLLQHVLDQLSDPQGFLHKVQELYQSQEESFDTLLFKDGRAFERVSRPLMEGDVLQGRVWSFRDITERKRAEQMLKTSEKRFRDIAENTQEWIWEVDVDGKYTYASPVVEKILGYAPDEILHKYFFDLFLPEDRESLKEAAFAAFASKQPFREFYNRNVHKNGQTIWLSTSGLPMFDSQGNLFGYRGVDSDITERKRSEDALKQSEAQYRLLADNMSDTIWLMDLNLKFTYVSPSVEKIRGYTLAELQQFTLDQLITPASFQAAMELFAVEMPKVMADPTYSPTHTLDIEFYKKDGTVYSVESKITIVRDGNGNPVSLLGQDRDITDRKLAEEQIRQLNAELEQRVEDRTRELRDTQEKLVRQEKLAVLGQLAGSVGHELRNPLNVINNAVYFLKLVQPDADEKIKKYHGMIEQEVRNSDKIITDLLDFARIKSVDRESVAVPELVQRVLTRFPVPAAVQVTLKLPATLPMVFADPRQMEQVLGNLTVNACQAMPQGGRLTISAVRKKDFVSIAVKDTGVGITPENMHKLFEPLFTTKLKGIGLGLAVSRKLAEANGGRIEVQSEPGHGSTFTLYLPVVSQ